MSAGKRVRDRASLIEFMTLRIHTDQSHTAAVQGSQIHVTGPAGPLEIHKSHPQPAVERAWDDPCEHAVS